MHFKSVLFIIRLIHYILAAVKSAYSISQAPSAGMPSVSHPEWTAAAQPPAQSNNQDPAPLASATACFPQLVWQSHHWNERHRSAELSEDPPAGEEQVGQLSALCAQIRAAHRNARAVHRPSLPTSLNGSTTVQTLKLVVVLSWKILHLNEMLLSFYPPCKICKYYCTKW